MFINQSLVKTHRTTQIQTRKELKSTDSPDADQDLVQLQTPNIPIQSDPPDTMSPVQPQL